MTKFSDDRTRQEKLMNNEREKTLEEKEQGRVFTTDKPNDFLEGEWFCGLVEFIYLYFKGESFTLTQEGSRKSRMLDSYVLKNILDISIDNCEDGKWFKVESLDTNYNTIVRNEDLINQMLAEIKNGTRQLVYTSLDKPKGKLNQSIHSRFAETLA